MRRKILFAVPTISVIEAGTTLAIANICQRDDIEYHAVTGGPIDHVRNGIVEIMLKDKEATHLLMMDSDVLPPENIVDLLLSCSSPMATGIVPLNFAGKIVSGVSRKGCFVESWQGEEEPFEVDAAGTGIVLVERKVFEEMEYPWFRFKDDRHGAKMGEDIFFSHKAADIGYKYMVHPKALCGHMKKINLLDIVKMFNHVRDDILEDIKEKELV